MLERYRTTMSENVARSWAEDAQIKLDLISEIMTELTDCLEASYSGSPEGRKYLEDARAALSS